MSQYIFSLILRPTNLLCSLKIILNGLTSLLEILIVRPVKIKIGLKKPSRVLNETQDGFILQKVFCSMTQSKKRDMRRLLSSSITSEGAIRKVLVPEGDA